MSLISKQINDLRAYAKDRKGEMAKLVSDAADTIEELSAKLSAANMERSSQYYHGGWIPCSERLPEKPDNYPCCGIYRTYFLVTLESGCVKSLGYEFDSDMWQITGSPVIAWMPLPEPYQAERREDG